MNILIIDDDRLVALSLKTILENEPDVKVLEVAGSGQEAIQLYHKYHADIDIVLMDIRMSGITGLDAGEKILSEYPHAKILYLTTFSDDEYIVRALRIGAKGYLLKQNYESIAPALKAVQMGQSVFGCEIMQKLPDLMAQNNQFDYTASGILQKELEIIRFVADGLSNKEIAESLFLSEGTVRNYLSTILNKLTLRDRTQLAIFYYQHKI